MCGSSERRRRGRFRFRVFANGNSSVSHNRTRASFSRTICERLISWWGNACKKTALSTRLYKIVDWEIQKRKKSKECIELFWFMANEILVFSFSENCILFQRPQLDIESSSQTEVCILFDLSVSRSESPPKLKTWVKTESDYLPRDCF